MLSLKNTSLVTFAAIVAAPLVVFWAWPYSSQVDARISEAGEHNLLLAQSVGLSIEFYHDEVVNAFEHVLSAHDANDGMVDTELLSGLGLRYAGWVDETTGAVRSKFGVRADLMPDTYSPGELAALKARLAAGKASALQVRIGADQQPELMLVSSRQGTILVAGVSTSELVRLAERINANREIGIEIVDGTGRIIASPLKHWEQQAKDLSDLQLVADLTTHRQVISQEDLPESSGPAIVAAVQAGDTGWGVLVHEPVGAASSAGSQTLTLSIAFLIILTAALVGSLATAPVVGPLMAVSRAARRMQDGDTDVRIAKLGWLTPKEVLNLSQAFNAMAESVASSRAQEAEARAKAEQANLSKTEFLRNVTHEVRTPLNAIIGFSEVLLNECRRMNLPHRQISHAEDISSAGRHMLSLINSLLDLSRIEAGQYQLQEAPTALDEVLARCVRFLGPAAQARKTQIEMHIAPELPDIVADERALFQSVLNLAANAIRYGREGGHVIISAVPSRLHGVEIAVSDNGPGIPAEYLDKVTEPFVRVASEANRNVEGSGLGLPIVKKLIELHGGSFVLESTLGAGTTARIRLPANRLLPRTDLAPAGQAAA